MRDACHDRAPLRGRLLGIYRTMWPDQAAFTLAELLVTVGVLVLLVLLATQLLNSAATVTTLGHRQMDADSQATQLFDRMAIDFAQMVKRSDVDLLCEIFCYSAACGSTQRSADRKRSNNIL